MDIQKFQFKGIEIYLAEAELITPDQLHTALQAQKLNGKKLEEILIMHGFVKQQTIDYFMANIVLPDREKIVKQQSHPETSMDEYVTLIEQTRTRNQEDAVEALRSDQLKLYLSITRILKFLLCVVMSFALASIVANFNIRYLPDFLGRDIFLELFNLDAEINLPSLYSTVVLAFCSILLAIIAQAQKLNKNSNFWSWIGLSVVFAGLSLDEFISLHERLIIPRRNTFNTSGFFYFAWVIAGAIFVLLFLLIFGRFIFTLPRKTRKLFFTAGTIYVAGAICTEMLGGYYVNHYQKNDMIYVLIFTLEEVLEMLGMIVFIYALLSYISCHMKIVDIGIRIIDRRK
jgi:hypothetical protein